MARVAPRPTVTGPLSDFVAVASARVLIPGSWRRQGAAAGRLSYRNTQDVSCKFTISYRTSSVLGPGGDAAGYVSDQLPAATRRHLLDSGQRGNRAYRVVRRPGIGGRVRVDALWAGPLTRRADIAPAGQAAWAEIRVAAISGAGDECHAGTWREALGPAIGDSVAVARAKLRFVRRR